MPFLSLTKEDINVYNSSEIYGDMNPICILMCQDCKSDVQHDFYTNYGLSDVASLILIMFLTYSHRYQIRDLFHTLCGVSYKLCSIQILGSIPQ